MAKAKKIRREIEIGGVKRWISGIRNRNMPKTSFGPCAVKRMAKRNSYSASATFRPMRRNGLRYFPSPMWKS